MNSVHSLMRVILRASRLFLFAQLGWLAGCQHSSEPANDNENAQVTIAAMLEAANGPKRDLFLVLTSRLQQLAGETARDCGAVRVNQKPETATACALSTHAERKSFYVSYSEWGMDTYCATGFAADTDGNAYKVEYDGGGWEKNGLRKNLQLSDGNHVAIERCSKPVKLRKSADGRVTCFLRDP
jgi:hypothetical protein